MTFRYGLRDIQNTSEHTLFALSNEKMFPIDTEEQIGRVLEFFHMIPHSKRPEAAKNINKQIKTLGIQTVLSEGHLFNKYRDMFTTTEAFISRVKKVLEITAKELIPIENRISEITKKKVFLKYANPVNLFSPDDIIKLEEEIFQHLDTFISRQQGGNMIGINMTMNDVIAYCINYDRAVHDSELIRTVLFYSLVSDIFEVAHDALQVGNVPKLKEVMDYLYDILKGNTYNIYHIRRHFLELSLQVSEIDNYTNLLLNNYANRNQFNDMDGYFKRDLNDNTKCAGIISDALSKIEKSCAGVSFKFVINNEIELTNMIIRGTSRELGIIDSTSRTVKHMQDIKKLMESEIDIINMKSLMKTSYSPKNVYFNTYAATDIKEGGNTVTDVLCFLDGTIREKNIQRYIPYCTLSLENNDINHFIKSRKINMIGLLDDEYGQRVYAGVSADRVYILAKSTHGKHTTYYLCRVYDVKDAEPLGAPSILDNLTASDENFIKEIKMPIIKLNYTGKIYASENRESVTEGITFDKNGDIKFIFNPRKSLMDEYAENHKLLKANSDNGNIQGMKDNLAFLFALITKIEREYLFKDSKKSEAEKKDAAKARAFAINDFKTYIKQVYKAEPTFNFNDYYESSNYGKYVVRVTNDDIKGAKLLFRTIMMS